VNVIKASVITVANTERAKLMVLLLLLRTRSKMQALSLRTSAPDLAMLLSTWLRSTQSHITRKIDAELGHPKDTSMATLKTVFSRTIHLISKHLTIRRKISFALVFKVLFPELLE
jgi:hypothetical protein